MAQDQASLPKNSWQVSNLRFTGFIEPGHGLLDQNWWTDIVGTEPDSETKTKAGEHVHTGPFSTGVLTLNYSALRVEWVYQVKEMISQDTPQFAILGNFEDKLEEFLQLINKWFSITNIPVFTRIAFGATSLQPKETHKSGYDTLSEYLKEYVKLDSEKSSDFVYQINRPRKIDIGDRNLLINRLTKWGLGRLDLAQRLLGLPEISTPMTSIFACLLEMDINTDQNSTQPINSNQIEAIFDKLVSLGKEIAAKGDIE